MYMTGLLRAANRASVIVAGTATTTQAVTVERAFEATTIRTTVTVAMAFVHTFTSNRVYLQRLCLPYLAEPLDADGDTPLSFSDRF